MHQQGEVIDRKRRDGWAGPGIEETVGEQEAVAALRATRAALHDQAVALYVAGCYEAAHVVIGTRRALDARYPECARATA